MADTPHMDKIASPKSAAWARSILTERQPADLNEDTINVMVGWIDSGEATQKFVSAIIDQYRNAPRKVTAEQRAQRQAEAANLPDVPEGRYALPHEDGTKFYKIDRPTEGKWAGFVFVKALASDTEYPIRNRAEKARILSEVAADVRGALVRYGHEIGACGVCGRTLTDEDSRAAGIGPVCAGRL